MKAHTGTDAASGLVHTVKYTAANVHDVTVAEELLHGQKDCVWSDAGYQGAEKKPENAGSDVQRITAMRPGKRRALDKSRESGRLAEQYEKLKARVRANGAPVPSHQAAVWLRQDTLPWIEKECSAVDHALCICECVWLPA